MQAMAEKKPPHVMLFFTWDVSLALWAEKGLLQREIRLYQALAERGVRVTFLSWGGKEDKDIALALKQTGIRTISLYTRIPRPKNQALRALASLRVPWILRQELKTADIFKLNQMWGGWVPALAKIICRKPFIARCGFELYDFTVRQGHGWLRRAFVWLISKFTYASADHICVATQDDKDFVVEHFDQPPGKITLHPNWIDTSMFVPQARPQKEKTVLFVGRLNEQKNLEMLIDALAGSDYTLDLVGEGELKDSLAARAKERGVVVNFLGSRPNDELPAIYNSYPVFILPSHYEGNPKTLLEAMACGRAVIGTNVHGISSVIEHGVSGFLCQPTVAGISDAIDIMMSDTALRERLGYAARAQIDQTQALDSLIAKELACYQSVM